jgi:hypothetical protein
MGWNDHITNLSLEADSVAVQARAIKHCELHDHIWIDRGDREANKHAYALGTIRWMNGNMRCTREEFMAAIDEVITYAAAECPACAKIRDE